MAEMYCVQVPEILSSVLFKFQRWDLSHGQSTDDIIKWYWQILFIDHCWIGWFQFTFWKGWIELKCPLVEADWDFVALSEQLFFFFCMFPDSCIVRCGAEDHLHQVDIANIKGNRVPYVDRDWQNSQPLSLFLDFFFVYHKYFSSHVSKPNCKSWLAWYWNW